MAKGTRGGRRGSGAATGGQTTSQRGGGGGLGGPNPVGVNVSTLTDKDADDLRQQEDDRYDPSTVAAIKMYISNTDFDNQGHSLSQTMNYLLDNGVDLNNADYKQINKQFGLHLTANDIASMQYTNGYISAAMHPIGKDVQLQRGAHDDLLRNTFGISDYTRYSESQLQSMLVGQAFQNTSPMSTSYDITKNPFLSSSSGKSGGREVVYRIKAGANTGMVFGAKAQSEIVLAAGTKWKITNVQYTGQIATPRGGRAKRQIVVDIETI